MNTIIFDLDGTLLPMDTKQFIKIYFHEMSLMFDGFIEPSKLLEYVQYCSAKMMTNEELVTNEHVFMKHFESLVGDKFEECKLRFDKFYKEAYFKTKAVTKTSPIMIEAVSVLKEKGYNLVVATNPMFPKEAIDHRVNWAGFSVDDFSHITSYEKNHYTKPNPKFYSEVLETIGRKSDECMMVGNDIKDDMVASKVGIKTYLITDYIIADDKLESEFIINHRGQYGDFFEFVKELPIIK